MCCMGAIVALEIFTATATIETYSFDVSTGVILAVSNRSLGAYDSRIFTHEERSVLCMASASIHTSLRDMLSN